MDEKMTEMEKKQEYFMENVLKAKDDQVKAQSDQIQQLKERLNALEVKEKGKGLQQRTAESTREEVPHSHVFTLPARPILNPMMPFENPNSGLSRTPNFHIGASNSSLGAYPAISFDPVGPERPKVEELGHVASNESTDKWKMIEDRLKVIERTNDCFKMDASQLSLVPDLVIPPKFKIPEFEKFDGNSCPTAHIKMFYRKMIGHTSNDKLLIHCFQESLSGSAIRWYNQLSSSVIRSWKDLALAFKEQYKYLSDLAPSRTTLQNMEKKPNESFKEYAHRWRNIAIQVQPPLADKELPISFIYTLKTHSLSSC